MFRATPSDFTNKLNPINWSTNAPSVWRHSYLIPLPAVSVGPPLAVRSPLPPSRTTPPPEEDLGSGPFQTGAPGPGDPVPGPTWSEQLFFEDVIFAGFRYRNVLNTSYKDDSQGPTKTISFQYEQYECLNTRSANIDDGGVDVDNGGSLCVPAGPNQMQLTFRKTVRFTQPEYCIEEVNALAEVLVPLALDIWLQSAMFNS